MKDIEDVIARATETETAEKEECEVARLEDEVRRRRNERNCERDAVERVAAKGSSIRIPRHAPSYHIDLAIVTILSSPAMPGCTIAAREEEGRR